jgi:hypothetical protein
MEAVGSSEVHQKTQQLLMASAFWTSSDFQPLYLNSREGLKEVTNSHFECTSYEEICVNVRMCIVYVLHNPCKTHHSNDRTAAYFEIGQDHFMLFLSSYSLLHNCSFWCIKRGCVSCRPNIVPKRSLTVNWRFRRIFLMFQLLHDSGR